MSAKKKIGAPESTDGFCLDSSALLTLWNDEPGAETVEEILRSGAKPFLSFMTVMECRYRLWKQAGREKAEEFRSYLELLPVVVVDTNEAILDLAVEIKAGHNLSVVDSWIIATAIQTDTVLVHKDPEFEPLKGRVRLLALPYKPKNRDKA
ncbi:MAG: PIN domain-containing protein [Deltaproteobacteria bacterium]|nr:PIN domain-containing protein [Deltaproteobacteria bacterium]